MTAQSNRQHYRIFYPDGSRPGLRMEGAEYPLLDLSEEGLRFSAVDSESVPVGTSIAGNIMFRRGETVAVSGRVVRVSGGVVAAQLDRKIPLGAILEEHLWLARAFPTE